MISKTLRLFGLAAALLGIAAFNGSTAFAQKPTPTPVLGAASSRHLKIPPTPGPGKIAIYIVNDYDVDMSLGPLGSGHRNGFDEISGVLSKQGGDYVGTVDGSVDSNQKMLSSMGGGCGGHYHDLQKLKITGHVVVGFPAPSYATAGIGGPPASLYHPGTYTGTPSSEYLMLEFTPVTKTPSQPTNFDPVTNQLSPAGTCHDLIIPQGDDTDDDDTSSAQPPANFDPSRFDGIAFLPFSDTRWTTKGNGYVIRMTSSGVLKYTDTQTPGTVPPFKVNKSVWSIHIVRVP